jgi:hypothetical protein
MGRHFFRETVPRSGAHPSLSENRQTVESVHSPARALRLMWVNWASRSGWPLRSTLLWLAWRFDTESRSNSTVMGGLAVFQASGTWRRETSPARTYVTRSLKGPSGNVGCPGYDFKGTGSDVGWRRTQRVLLARGLTSRAWKGRLIYAERTRSLSWRSSASSRLVRTCARLSPAVAQGVSSPAFRQSLSSLVMAAESLAHTKWAGTIPGHSSSRNGTDECPGITKRLFA